MISNKKTPRPKSRQTHSLRIKAGAVSAESEGWGVLGLILALLAVLSFVWGSEHPLLKSTFESPGNSQTQSSPRHADK